MGKQIRNIPKNMWFTWMEPGFHLQFHWDDRFFHVICLHDGLNNPRYRYSS